MVAQAASSRVKPSGAVYSRSSACPSGRGPTHLRRPARGSRHRARVRPKTHLARDEATTAEVDGVGVNGEQRLEGERGEAPRSRLGGLVLALSRRARVKTVRPTRVFPMALFRHVPHFRDLGHGQSGDDLRVERLDVSLHHLAVARELPAAPVRPAPSLRPGRPPRPRRRAPHARRARPAPGG